MAVSGRSDAGHDTRFVPAPPGNPKGPARDQRKEPALTRLLLAAVASVAAGLAIGAVTTVSVTLAMDHHHVGPAQDAPTPTIPNVVQYGDRCGHGQDCLSALPRRLRP